MKTTQMNVETRLVTELFLINHWMLFWVNLIKASEGRTKHRKSCAGEQQGNALVSPTAKGCSPLGLGLFPAVH